MGPGTVAVDALLHRVECCLRPACQTQLGEDVRDVRPRGALGDPEGLADGPIWQPFGDQPEDVALARGQRRVVDVRDQPAGRAQLTGDDPGHRRREIHLAVARGADRRRDIVGLGVLEQETGGARRDGRYDPLLFDGAGQRDDFDLRARRPELAVASTPSSRGRLRSMTTTSGRSDSVAVSASRPSAASPTTSMSSKIARNSRRPRRTIAWSSTRSTRVRGTHAHR